MHAKFAKTRMNNTDFWKHIDTIIAQGFDARELKQLEQYAELFISGQLLINTNGRRRKSDKE